MTFILTLKRSSHWKRDDPHCSNLNGSLSKEASATLALSSIIIQLLGACHYGSALWQGFLLLIVIHCHYLSVSLQLPSCTSHHFLHKSLKPHFLPEWLGNHLGLCAWTVGVSSHTWLWNIPSTASMFLQWFFSYVLNENVLGCVRMWA